MGIDKASILADRYKNNRGQLAAALMDAAGYQALTSS